MSSKTSTRIEAFKLGGVSYLGGIGRYHVTLACINALPELAGLVP